MFDSYLQACGSRMEASLLNINCTAIYVRTDIS